jgi:hypothetical protein
MSRPISISWLAGFVLAGWPASSIASDGPSSKPGASYYPRSTFVTVDLGPSWGSHKQSVQSAEQTYDLESGSGLMSTARGGWQWIHVDILIALGAGVMYGQYSAEGGSYGNGDIHLTQASTYLLGFGRVGYAFRNRWMGFIGLDLLHPLTESVTVEAPTGTATSQPDGGIETGTHATTLTMRYALMPRLAVEGTIYLPALIHADADGRGYDGLTVGSSYAL